MKVRVIGADGRMGRIHCQTYRDLGLEIVESGEDIVSIASPDQTHGAYVEKALEEGKHVFCEKPLCTDWGQYVGISRALEKAPHLHVGQNFPLRYTFADARDAIENNPEQRVYRAEFTYEWGRFEKLGKGWRTGNYSLVMGGLIHMADLAIWLLGDLRMEYATDVHLANIGDLHLPDGFVMASFVSCRSDTAAVRLTLDGGPGPKVHAHHVVLSGYGWYYQKTNCEPADKTLQIKNFVKNLDKPPQNDLRATALCLEIDGCIGSTSRVH